MDPNPLRLLLLDPSADDAEVALARLAGGRRLKALRVPDAAALRRALAAAWDAVITEHAPPRIDAALVLDALRAAGRDVPLLVLARAVGDDDLAKLMRAGVRDVILKDQSGRLLPALERELAAAADRAEHRAALRALEELEQKHRAVVQAAREAVCYCQDGMHLEANRAYLEIFGYADIAELEGVPVLDLIDKADHARFKQHMRKPGAGPGQAQEFSALRRNGERFHVEVAVTRVVIKGETCTQLLVSDVSGRKAAEARLQYLNRHDALTGLYNRRYFLQLLERVLAQSQGEPRAVVYLDLQDLRQVIQEAGHAVADRLLLAAARALRTLFGADTALARYGDHEFAALVRGEAAGQLDDLAARVRQALAAGPLRARGVPDDFGYHLSFAPITPEVRELHGLMSGLYAAPAPRAAPAQTKAPSFRRPPPPPARLSAASPPVVRRARNEAQPREIDWKRRIAHALERGGLRLVYQPVVNLHGEPAERFEVFVRLVDDDGKLVPARHFMAEAENSGQAATIDRWVVTQSIRTLAELRGQGRKVAFFINLSARGLADPELALAAHHALTECRLGGKHVIFEVDEAALASAPEAAAAFLDAVERIGCRICIDNFGRMAPGVERVRAAAIEYLKLDGALCANLVRDQVARASLRAVVDVARAMGKRTVAKGIESAEALPVLWEAGVDYVQGNYFQEGDTALDYQFEDEATITFEQAPAWAVANPDKSR